MSDIKNLPHSIRERLKYQARQSGKPFNWHVQLYAMERFLYRLSTSKYCDKFVLKGGLTFISWQIPLRRFTKDIDFRAFTSNDLESIERVIQEICLQEVEPDGMEFKIETGSAAVITEEAEYPGARVRFTASLGERFIVPMQVDIGFSDLITPEPQHISYPTSFGMPAPEILVYPKESVVAEKLECLVYRGSINSRYKDFYDLWFVSRQLDFDGRLLRKAVITTFKNRETIIPSEIPPGLSDEYAFDKQKEWLTFLRGFSPDIPEIEDFHFVIVELRKFLLPIIRAISENYAFDSCWNSGELIWKTID